MAGRGRVDLVELAGPAQTAKVPGFVKASPARSVRVTDIAANPLNTRVVTEADAQEMAQSLTLHGQLSACVVVTRAAFLRIFPERAAEIGDCGYVQVVGARRLAGAVHAKRPTLEVQVKDELAGTRLKFLGATAAENLDRKDLNPIEEARAIGIMTAEPGVTQADVAKVLGRSAPWVTQRLHLLDLVPELQELVVTGELTIEAGRKIGVLPQDKQVDAYEQWLAERNAPPAGDPDPEPEEPAAPAADKPERVKPDKIVTAVRHLGSTGPAIAQALAGVLPDDDLRSLYETLRERFAA